MKAEDIERMRSAQGWRRDRTEVFDTADGRVIVKGQRPPRNQALLKTYNGLVAMLGAGSLRAVPSAGGADAQAVEVRRLRELAAAGVRVPQVLHVDAEFFAMEFLPGMNLAQLLEGRAHDGESTLIAWRRGLELLQSIHQRGQYLSQASARNLMHTAEGLVPIDLEEDPLVCMSLAQAQARDWLLYLQSTIWLLPQPRSVLLSIWRDVLRNAPSLEAQALASTVGQLGWLRHLPEKRKPWGRDIVSAQAAAAFLHDWADADDEK
jgi:hypothetical protein